MAIGCPSPCAAVDRGVVHGLTWRFKFRFVRAVRRGNRWWVLLEVDFARIGKRCANIHLRGDVHVTQTDLSFVVCDSCQFLFWRREPKLYRSVQDRKGNELGRGSGDINSIPICSCTPNSVQPWRSLQRAPRLQCAHADNAGSDALQDLMLIYQLKVCIRSLESLSNFRQTLTIF